jgi:phage terminase large subunit-like protein
MIGGPSGLARIGLEEERPRFESSRRRLIWPNGAEGYVFSAEDPDSLRGPQIDTAWADGSVARRSTRAPISPMSLWIRKVRKAFSPIFPAGRAMI